MPSHHTIMRLHNVRLRPAPGPCRRAMNWKALEPDNFYYEGPPPLSPTTRWHWISKPRLSNSHSCNQPKAQNVHLKALAFEVSFLQPRNTSKRTSQSRGLQTLILATNQKAQNVHLKALAFEVSFLQPRNTSKRTSQRPGF